MKRLKRAEELVEVTFMVSVPESTPEDDTIYITGSHPNIGYWKTNAVRLSRMKKSYYATVELPDNQVIQYKYTRGDWDTVEMGQNFSELHNRSVRIKDGIFIKDTVEGWRDQIVITARTHTMTGDIREHDVESVILKGKRHVLVYLPPDYERETRKYPVVYLQDGNNMFDSFTAFLGVEWGMDESLERLITAGEIEPVIAVAVYNSPYRDDEYTFCRDKRERSGGKADKYLSFLTDELMPFIESHYRAQHNREDTGIIGSSLGGLLSLYAGYKFNDTFGKLGVVSPSLWWSNGSIMKIINKKPEHMPKIWMDMGTLEGAGKSILRTRMARRMFIETGLKEGRDFMYYEDHGADHTESDWARRVPMILKFLYGKKKRA